MIIRTPDDVTQAVLSEVDRTADSRLRGILRSAVHHLHGFVREVGLTQAEFQQLCACVAHARPAQHAAGGGETQQRLNRPLVAAL